MKSGNMSEYYIRISELIYKESLGKLTDQEQEELDRWLDESADNRRVYEGVVDKKTVLAEYGKFHSLSGERSWGQIEKMAVSKKRLSITKWWWAAAMVAFFIAGSYILVIKEFENQLRVAEVYTFDSIRPGTSKAVLQLANGQKIALQNTVMNLKTEVADIKQTGNGLKYEADSLVTMEKMNILTTPQGGEFNVTLSDGTKVWLNAGSRLEYPEVFVGTVREVKLQGEAYFEVEKSEGKSFIIEANGIDIKVLGTCFNVKAFHKEGRIMTTLLEGSVELNTGRRKVVLIPNQQACYIPDIDDLSVRTVEATDYVAWKDGKFVFRRERLEWIMETIARWYDVAVFYQNPEVKDILFSGKMDRYGSVEETLRMIEHTGKVQFKLNKKGLIVMAK